MDSVVVSSLSTFPAVPGQVITRGTACSMRVLRRLGALAVIGGICSITGRTLRWRAGHIRFAGQAVKRKPARTNQERSGVNGRRIGNWTLRTWIFTGSIRRTCACGKPHLGRQTLMSFMPLNRLQMNDLMPPSLRVRKTPMSVWPMRRGGL